MTEILVSIISGAFSLSGAVIAAIIASRGVAKKSAVQMQTAQAVTTEKIAELTREVREHNNFAQRMPVVEEQIKVINHRIADLENYHKGA